METTKEDRAHWGSADVWASGPTAKVRINALLRDLAEQERELERLRAALFAERVAHAHARICGECEEPSLPGNGCPKWHELQDKSNELAPPGLLHAMEVALHGLGEKKSE